MVWGKRRYPHMGLYQSKTDRKNQQIIKKNTMDIIITLVFALLADTHFWWAPLHYQHTRNCGINNATTTSTAPTTPTTTSTTTVLEPTTPSPKTSGSSTYPPSHTSAGNSSSQGTKPHSSFKVPFRDTYITAMEET